MPQPPRVATEADLVRIAQFNCTQTPFPDDVTLQALIETQMARHAARTAVICDHDTSSSSGIAPALRGGAMSTSSGIAPALRGGAMSIHAGQSLTYAELNAKVNQLAHALRAEGVGPGHIVAIMVERSFAMIIGVLGIIKAGAAYLPIAPDNPPDRIDYLLTDAGVKVLLVHDGTAARARFAGRIVNVDDAEVYRGSTGNPAILTTADDLAYVIYTSGSTGKPKGVMIEHRSLLNRLHWMQYGYSIGVDDVILQKTPYCFDVSVWELFWWALGGAQLCFLRPGGERNPLAIVDVIQRRRVTILHFVPSMLNVFLEYLDGKPASVLNGLASVRRVFASGEALTPSHVRKFNDIWAARTGAQLTNLYGPTEATVDVSYFDCPAHNEVDIIPIGRPIHNIRLYVIRDDQQVAIGETGELCIAGVGLARGYLNNAALTAEKFTDNPVTPGERIYRTGDVARWLPDGNIEYLGREDHQVKIRGLRIELGEIESTIREYPGITDCVAVVKRYSDIIILIVAYLVCKPGLDIRIAPPRSAGAMPLLDGLKQHVKRHLPDYMIPHRFEQIDAMPLTPSGKADRKALPEPVIQGRP